MLKQGHGGMVSSFSLFLLVLFCYLTKGTCCLAAVDTVTVCPFFNHSGALTIPSPEVARTSSNVFVNCTEGNALASICLSNSRSYPSLCYSTNAAEGTLCGGVSGTECVSPASSYSLSGFSASVNNSDHSTLVLCGKEDQFLTCPSDYPILVSFCGNLYTYCNWTALPCSYFGLLCSRNSRLVTTSVGNTTVSSVESVAIEPYTCDWVHLNSSGIGRCEGYAGSSSNSEVFLEIATGICFAATQKQCGGTPNSGRIRCCLLRDQGSCVVPSIWQRIAERAVCSPMTALVAACAVRCQPFGSLFGYGMLACRGRVYSRNESFYSSSCEVFPSCPKNFIAISFSQCLVLGPGPATQVHCQRVAYGVIDNPADCVEVKGNGNVWCPSDYYVIAMCSPNSPKSCPGGVDVILRCCRVRNYHNNGRWCTPRQVFTVAGNAPLAAPYGVTVEGSLDITAVGTVNAVAQCGNKLYVSVAEEVVYTLDFDTDRANITIGLFNNGGYDSTKWSPDLWGTANTRIHDPVHVATRSQTTNCEDLFIVEQANFFVRFVRSIPGTYFEAFVSAGKANSTSAHIMTNSTPVLQAELNTISASYYRESSGQLFISTKAAILVAQLTGPSKLAQYFVGDGITQAASTPDIFRTSATVFSPLQLAIVDDEVLLAADYDGASINGIVHTVVLSSGVTSQLSALPLVVPYGLVIYQRIYLYLSDTFRHCIYVMNLQINTANLAMGECGTSGFADRTDMRKARFSSPKYMSLSQDTLYIADSANLRVRAVVLNNVICNPGFEATALCQACAIGYYGYPQCRQQCTISDDCSSHAVAVTGFPGACQCQCVSNFEGLNCGYCRQGLDLRSNCTTCAPSYDSYPVCRTLTTTPELTTTSTLTLFLTITQSVTPPPTPSRSTTFTGSHLLTRSGEETPTLVTLTETATASGGLTPSLDRSITRHSSTTVTYTFSMTVTKTQVLTPSGSTTVDTMTVTASNEPTLTKTIGTESSEVTVSDGDLSVSTSFSSRKSASISDSHIQTPTETLSNPLIAPTLSILQEQYIDTLHNVPFRSLHFSPESFHSDVEVDRQIAFQLHGGHWDVARILQVTEAPLATIPPSTQSSANDGTTSPPTSPPVTAFSLPNIYLPKYQREAILLSHHCLSSIEVGRDASIKNQYFASLVEQSLQHWYRVAFNVNKTIMFVTLDDQPSFPLFEYRFDLHEIYFNFTSDCVETRVPPSNVANLTLFTLPPPPLISAGVADSAAVVGWTSSIAIVIALSPAGDPSSLGALVSVIFPSFFLWRLAENHFQTHLPWFYHLIPLAVGEPTNNGEESVLRYYVGALVVNSVLFLLPLLIHASIAHFQSEQHKESLLTGCARVYFPSFHFVVFKYLLFPTVSSMIVVLVSSEQKFAGLTYAFLGTWCILVIAWMVISSLLIPRRVRCLPKLIIDVPRGVKRFFVAGFEWEDRGNKNFPSRRGRSSFRKMFFPLFSHLKGERTGFQLVEILLLTALASLEGFTIVGTNPELSQHSSLLSAKINAGDKETVSMSGVATSATILIFLYSCFILFRRPYVVMFTGFLQGIWTLLNLSSGVLSMAAYFHKDYHYDPDSIQLRRASSALAISAMFLPVFHIIVPAVHAMAFCRKRFSADDSVGHSASLMLTSDKDDHLFYEMKSHQGTTRPSPLQATLAEDRSRKLLDAPLLAESRSRLASSSKPFSPSSSVNPIGNAQQGTSPLNLAQSSTGKHVSFSSDRFTSLSQNGEWGNVSDRSRPPPPTAERKIQPSYRFATNDTVGGPESPSYSNPRYLNQQHRATELVDHHFDSSSRRNGMQESRLNQQHPKVNNPWDIL